MDMQNDPNTDLIVVASMRYCMGRATYMPHAFMDWARRHWDFLSDRAKAIMIRELEKECGREHPKLGMDIDEVEWRRFLVWMKKKADSGFERK